MMIKDCSLFDNNYLLFIETHFVAYDIGFANVKVVNVELYLLKVVSGAFLCPVSQ